MKNSTILFSIVAVFTLSACKTVKVNDNDFAWKSFDNSEKDQFVDFGQYQSPNTRAGQDPNKVVIVCSSGGGSRAASFTTGIMLELEKIRVKDIEQSPREPSNALGEVDYFSTVSGGGWGASSYIAYLYQKHKYSEERFAQAIQKYNNGLSDQEFEKKGIESFPTFNSYEKYLANRADFRYYKQQIPLIFSLRFGAKKSDMKMTNRLNAGYLGWSYRKEVESKIWNDSTKNFSPNDVDEVTLGDVFIDKGKPCYMPILINTDIT
jgi:hypothetical protein